MSYSPVTLLGNSLSEPMCPHGLKGVYSDIWWFLVVFCPLLQIPGLYIAGSGRDLKELSHSFFYFRKSEDKSGGTSKKCIVFKERPTTTVALTRQLPCILGLQSVCHNSWLLWGLFFSKSPVFCNFLWFFLCTLV